MGEGATASPSLFFRAKETRLAEMGLIARCVPAISGTKHIGTYLALLGVRIDGYISDKEVHI